MSRAFFKYELGERVADKDTGLAGKIYVRSESLIGEIAYTVVTDDQQIFIVEEARLELVASNYGKLVH